MFNREVFGMAVDRFRKHPVQTSLTLAGLVVGTASIILVVTLGLTGRGYVLRQIEGVGSHLVWANYRGTVNSGVSRVSDDFMTEGDVRAIAARNDLFSGVTAILTLRGNVTVQSQSKALTVLGVMANYGQVRKNMRILRGRFLDDDDVQQRARVCVVNRDLYQQLFANDDSPDKTIRTLGTTFQVVGEFEEPVDTLGRGDVVPETILIPLTVAWYFTPTHQVKTLFAEAREFSELPAAVAGGRGHAARAPPHRARFYEVESMTSVVRLARAISVALIVVFILAAAVSVVVGGVGIMNILLASVEQRHAGDRCSHVGRRSAPRHPRPVPLRGALSRRGRRGDRRGDRSRDSLPDGALRARRGHPRLALVRGGRLCLFLRGRGGVRRRARVSRVSPQPFGGLAP